MKTLTIPKRFGYPTLDITVNGKEYTVKSGEEITVEDHIAEAIENAIALAPKLGVPRSRFAQFVEGNVKEVKSEELDGITAISRCAFYNYDNLTSIAVPDDVTTIGNEAFSDCGSLKSVIFGENSRLTNIDGYAFYKCTSLTTITIPKNVTSIGYATFSNCTGLKKVIAKALTPPTIKSDTLSNVPTTCVIEVPSEALNAYKTAEFWSTMANQIVAMKE